MDVINSALYFTLGYFDQKLTVDTVFVFVFADSIVSTSQLLDDNTLAK